MTHILGRPHYNSIFHMLVCQFIQSLQMGTIMLTVGLELQPRSKFGFAWPFKPNTLQWAMGDCGTYRQRWSHRVNAWSILLSDTTYLHYLTKINNYNFYTHISEWGGPNDILYHQSDMSQWGYISSDTVSCTPLTGLHIPLILTLCQNHN